MLRLSKRIDPDFVAILVLLTLGLIAYSNSFLTTFHYDDFTRIIENDAIFDLSNLGRIYSYCKQRYLTYLTLAINYKISITTLLPSFSISSSLRPGRRRP
jgi:hypothetical protein